MHRGRDIYPSTLPQQMKSLHCHMHVTHLTRTRDKDLPYIPCFTTMSFCGYNREHFRDHFEEGNFKFLSLHNIHHTRTHTGIYVCVKCGHPLFESTRKFDHPSAWPAFSKTVSPDSVRKEQETATAFRVSCGQCGQRLGHEFLHDGPSYEQSRF